MKSKDTGKYTCRASNKAGSNHWLTLFCQIWMIAFFITMQSCQCFQVGGLLGHNMINESSFALPLSSTDAEKLFAKLNSVKVKKVTAKDNSTEGPFVSESEFS